MAYSGFSFRMNQFHLKESLIIDRFAVAGQKMFPGKLASDMWYGHIPHEISRLVWYAMAKGANVTTCHRYKTEALIQGGVEILIMVNVEWDNADDIRTLKEKVESGNFPVGEDEEYKDDSNEIFKSIGVGEGEKSGRDSNI